MAPQTQPQEPLAITGVSYRFPGSNDDDHKLWDLLKNGRDSWGKLPEDRYSQQAYHHPDPQHAGSIAAEGGCFMDRDPAAFDAPFFGISPAEASALDPQQRYLLETTYECLESAGVSMEKISGSKTGCFAGSFLKDYDMITAADLLDVPTYAAVGGAGSFLSNRVSWFYNLKGPSLTCDTACSSSLIAFHLACQSVWSGESDQAFAAGASMILMPNAARALTQMQFLSPDGKCYSFDDRGNGYGRGEGFVMLLIKPVSAAIRDGDCIRAVVRASASNQNGRSPGITMPSTEAQAQLIRTAYQQAGLDFDTTGYFEAHGTGTPIGDPLEFNAIAQTLANKETRSSPLIVGSIKSNIGHLEGTAGLAGLVKAILCVEEGMIPPLANFEKPNPKLRLDDPNLQLATKLMEWPSSGIRRASINSFGAGGSNAHVVIDDAASFLQTHGLKGHHRTKLSSFSAHDSGVESGESTDDEASPGNEAQTVTTRIYPFSAPSQAALQRMAAAYGDFLKDKIEAGAVEDAFKALDAGKSSSDVSKLNLEQLARTLCTHRSVFDWKSFAIASSATELRFGLEEGLPKFAKPTKTSGIAFVFSGQGAQSARMGVELLQHHVFHQHIQEANTYLQGIGCTWSVMDELCKSATSSKIDNAEYAQPLSTILQTGLVDLLAYWGVVPKSVVGHSSGEIAGAYAIGALSKQDAWKVAYFRGKFSAAVSDRQPDRQGAMMAVGMGEAETSEYLGKHADSNVVIACVNSPNSVTLSGPQQSIIKLATHLQGDKIFQSSLRVNNAYHSPEMLVISDDYSKAIADIKPLSGNGPVMFSSVTGKRIEPSELNAQYWVDNMLNKVQFTAAVDSLLSPVTKSRGRRKGKFDVDTFLEVGPHSALQSPLQQIIKLKQESSEQDSQLSYQSVLRRGNNAAEAAIAAAGQLWVAGHPVNLAKVNQPSRTIKSLPPLTELPAYPWDHSDKNKFWHETPYAHMARVPAESRNDFLGILEDDNANTPEYRNLLRLDEQPWIADHEIQGVVMLPATAFVVMAIEAAAKTFTDGKVAQSIELRDVIVQRPLLFQDKAKPIETRVALKPHKMGTRLSNAPWTHVAVSSRSTMDNTWNEHASCYFMVHYKRQKSEVEGTRDSEDAREAKACQERYFSYKEECTIENSVSTIYLTLDECGFKYGPLFQNLNQLYCGPAKAVGQIKIPDTKSTMPKGYESPHVIHPIVLDNALQLINPALRDSGLKSTTMLPTAMETVIVDLDVPNAAGTQLKGYSDYELRGFQEIMAQIVLGAESFEKPLVTIKNLFCQEVAGIMDLNTGSADKMKPIATELIWKEDVDLLTPSALQKVLGKATSNGDSIPEHHKYFLELVDLQSFKNPSLSVLEIGSTGPELAACTIARLTDPGQGARIDKYEITGQDAKPEWATEVTKQYPGTVEYSRLDLTSAEDDDEAKNKVDSIVCFDTNMDIKTVGMLLEEANERLNPAGRLSFTMKMSQTDLEASSQDLKTMVQQSGYFGIDASFGLANGSMFVTSTKVSEVASIQDRDILFIEPVKHDGRVLSLMEHLEKEFKANGSQVSRATLETLPSTEKKAIVSFIGLGEETLNQMSSSEFTAWRSMLLRNSGLMWVSAGAIKSSKNPLRAMDTGALRVLKSEEATLRLVQFDYSEDMDITSSAATKLLLDAAKASLFAYEDENIETEITEKDGKLFIPRLFTEQSANEAIYYQTHHPSPRKQKIGDSNDKVLQMRVGTAGMLDTLRFAEAEKFPTSLAPGQAKVRVQATPINFVDVMVAMGMVPAASLGCECAGVVVEAREDGRFQVGDQVVVMTGNSFATHVIEDESFMQPVPAGMTPAAAASCATIYATAYVALMDVARIQSGESVLIHAGAGGLGQAAIQLARMVGAEIFVTVGSVAKKNLIMEKYSIAEDHIFNSRDVTFAKGVMRQTGQRGVDVILNSTSGEALRQTWHCIAPYGRFLEVGKRDIMMNTGLDMTPFIRNVSYSGVHIDQMVGPARTRVSVAMEKVFDLLGSGQVGEVHPIKVMTYTEMEEAFRLVQAGKHTGKVVLTQSDEDTIQVIPPVADKLKLKPDVTYAIAGGLGGVGQSMVDSMFDCGARNFAFFSRSGDSKPEASEYLGRLRRRGATANAYKADIADFDALAVAVKQMESEMPPVKGFLNSAMYLQDCLLANMTYEQWCIGIAPKVAGTWNFHNLLPSGLDFFVSLSSISAMIGVPGQTNYAAANTYQDALAFWRRSQGEEAISLNLSAIFGVGVLEDAKDSRSGYYDIIAINETEMNSLLAFAMKKTTLRDVPCPTQLTTGVNPAMLNVPGLQWCFDPKFRMIRRLGQKSGQSVDDSEKSKLREELQQCTSLPTAAKMIEENLLVKMSKGMACNPEDINTSKPLHSFGVDSLVAVEVRNWLFKELKSEITVFDIMDPQPITALCHKVAEKSKLISAEVKAGTKE